MTFWVTTGHPGPYRSICPLLCPCNGIPAAGIVFFFQHNYLLNNFLQIFHVKKCRTCILSVCHVY